MVGGLVVCAGREAAESKYGRVTVLSTRYKKELRHDLWGLKSEGESWGSTPIATRDAKSPLSMCKCIQDVC